MLKQIIEECFADIKTDATPHEAKRMFGFIWSALAGKRVRLIEGEVYHTWRSLSSQLATIYNEWFNQRFTTDAFLKAVSPNLTMGESNEYDDVVMRISKHSSVIGMFAVSMGPPPTLRDAVGVFQEVNIITGEQHYYQQPYQRGRVSGAPERISGKQYETLCYSIR